MEMRITFIDFATFDYTPATPLERPLGGMQSALCYLAGALADRGHDIVLINQTTQAGTFGGVTCVNVSDARAAARLRSTDIVVSISCAGASLRQGGLQCPLVLWTGHDITEKAVQALSRFNERLAWNRIVMVSQWQADRFSEAFKINKASIRVIGNAIAPPFESVFRQNYFFETGRPPVLAYTSTPFRGLNVLLRAMPILRSLIPGCTARIYSSMAVYQSAPGDDRYAALYDQCRQTEGVEYCGSLSQSALSAAMADVDILAYPSTFLETSCIVLMEAMASGCMVISSDQGALPETAAGFGYLCRREAGDSEDAYADHYARFATRIIQEAYGDAANVRSRLESQRAHARKNYVWSSRAEAWEQFLEEIAHQPPPKLPQRNEPCLCGSGQKFKRCCGALIGEP